jgi:hypothetical protein
MKQHRQLLNENLRSGDLKNYVSEVFTVDLFRSKMGEDSEIVVLGFQVKDKFPAVDLMEFIERGYKFILDADMSAGEELDGSYHVFVEIERSPQLVEQLNELLYGLGQLCDCRSWDFRYQKNSRKIQFSRENIQENIPLTKQDYERKILEIKNQDVQEFFDQGSVEVSLDEDNILKFKRPFAEDVRAKFVAIGDYEAVSKLVPGPLSLDENSQGQIFFLNKFLGNYDIDKIGNKFLIKNQDQAILIEKDRW